MTRTQAIDTALAAFDTGTFASDLARKVAYQTTSEVAGNNAVLRSYLVNELVPELTHLGFTTQVYENQVQDCGPYLIAERIENPAHPTVLMYGHGDVIRGQDEQWLAGTSPWSLTVRGGKMYGRGTADNKGQLTVNTTALGAVLATRGGKLGFNVRLLIETAEERGSLGINDFCRAHADELAADLFLASDGPRLNAQTPTLFLGSRGVMNFSLTLELRDGAHHSGNWGGLLRNPGTVLASAIASLVNERGVIMTPLLRPGPISAAVKQRVAELKVGGNDGDPSLDENWGEPNLSAAERVFAWNTVEVLGLECGSVQKPIGAIPFAAKAVCQLRYVVGTDLDFIEQRLQDHFERLGMPWVCVKVLFNMKATQLDPNHHAVSWVTNSIKQTTGKTPAVLPNLGGTIPNDAFSEVLGLPTVWIPHSYPACSQHAPNEHMLESVAREGLAMMAGLFWDMGDSRAHAPEHLKREAHDSRSPL